MADIDLQRMGGGGGGGSHPDHPDPAIRGGGAVANFFQPFGPQFGLKITGGREAPRASPLDPPLKGIASLNLHIPPRFVKSP